MNRLSLLITHHSWWILPNEVIMNFPDHLALAPSPSLGTAAGAAAGTTTTTSTGCSQRGKGWTGAQKELGWTKALGETNGSFVHQLQSSRLSIPIGSPHFFLLITSSILLVRLNLHGASFQHLVLRRGSLINPTWAINRTDIPLKYWVVASFPFQKTLNYGLVVSPNGLLEGNYDIYWNLGTPKRFSPFKTMV